MRVVFDTVILVRSLINPRSRWGRLIFDLPTAYKVIVSPDIVAEHLGVLWRPELVLKYRDVAGRDPQAILALIARASVVEPEEVPTICRDPDDDKFLAAAITGEAEFIVTEDADLLDVGRYADTAIVSAEAFLRILDAREHPESRKEVI